MFPSLKEINQRDSDEEIDPQASFDYLNSVVGQMTGANAKTNRFILVDTDGSLPADKP